MNNIEIGTKLKELRKSRSLKQWQVAEGVGLSRAAISNIEAGRRSLTLSTLQTFADFYKVDVSTITDEIESSKDEVIDLLERTRKVFENENVDKTDKEELYLRVMEFYLKLKK